MHNKGGKFRKGRGKKIYTNHSALRKFNEHQVVFVFQDDNFLSAAKLANVQVARVKALH